MKQIIDLTATAAWSLRTRGRYGVFEGTGKGTVWHPWTEVVESALTFTSKSSYLEWTANWYWAYTFLAQEIRQAKQDRKTKTSVALGVFPPGSTRSVSHLRDIAFLMLELRKESRHLAGQQRDLHHIV